ncbi:MAG: alpha-galactosidase, partial [Clostridia bacterium]|nr:alpha-galactosidase [Clostridia bacterium]
MADFSWKGLRFGTFNGTLCLKGVDGCELPDDSERSVLSQIQIEGEHKNSHSGNKVIRSSEEQRLRYVGHEESGDKLTVTSRSELIEAKVTFEYHGGAYAVSTAVTNVSDGEIALEYVSSLFLSGIGGASPDENNIFLYTFPQGHHRECQPRRLSLYDLGLFTKGNTGQNRIAVGNVGGWSTKEYLPQLIIEDAVSVRFFMCQIESNSSWYSEISEDGGRIYLYTGGARECFGSWRKVLNPGERYETVRTAFAASDSLDGVAGKMTGYRRDVAGYSGPDRDLPVIYNEYMHFSWDSPTEENTRAAAPVAASCGVEYYVIDCGWHNEEPGSEVYPYVGQWKESHARFPSGLRKTLDFIKSLGMKPGLWIEPEIIGNKCTDMLNYYGDGDFLTRGGRPIHVMGRYFLDFRSQRVRDYLTETIRRMAEDYGAEYIKFDYNEELGVGCDGGDSLGEGLEQATAAFLSWVNEVRERHPGVIFEACASGGMRMDG